MPQSLILCLYCAAAMAVVAIVAIRVSLGRQSRRLQKLIAEVVPYRVAHQSTECASSTEAGFNDVTSDLENAFSGTFITHRDAESYSAYYECLAGDVRRFVKRCATFKVRPAFKIREFAYDFDHITTLVKIHNDRVCNDMLATHKDFFDHCLTYPLDAQQRRSIVSEEDNCLVVSSAGSGKTSSIVGKVKYLIEVKHADPKRILLISYTNKAAAELTERMNVAGLRGYTFHKLALDIIAKATGQKPTICDNTDALFVRLYHELLNNRKFKKDVTEYYLDYKLQDDEQEQRKNERRQQLAEQKSTRLRALLPDMDGNTVYVRSEQELKICFALSSLGVNFRYEEPYEHPLADEMHSQYKPDFSIYYRSGGQLHRIYLEHFGVDEHGLVPSWFANDLGVTYEEANQKYNDGITWKRAAHEKFGTTLIATSSADFRYADIRSKLKSLLREAGVPVSEKSDDELYDMVLPPGSKQEKAFIRIVVTFATLLKSSCKSVHEVLRQAEAAGDKRSVSVIKNVFGPVCERYAAALRESNQIDFTDAILQATEICRTSHAVVYDHIIVDEFQDISVDRYNFLKALRAGNPPAKLYCVGDDWQSIYRFLGSDMALFNQFADYFGPTEINKIETTYRFGEPLVALSSAFIQRNAAQIKKDIRPFDRQANTELLFCDYGKYDYCDCVERLLATIPHESSVFLLGRYSFDDYYLSSRYKSVKEGNRFYYLVGDRKIEFLTVHKSKGLEADYVIVLQCNRDTYGFPSLVSDDRALGYVLTKSDQYPYAEERRLFYVAITRAKVKTFVLYDRRTPSVFVDEFLHPEKLDGGSVPRHPNANKTWTRRDDNYLLALHRSGRSVKFIAEKMGRSQTAIVMRLEKLLAKRS